MIIDSHAHVWVLQPERYPWSPIGGYIPQTEAPVETLLLMMDQAGVDGAILVQPTPYGWDNRYLLGAVQKAPNRLRAVCLVDPFSDESRQVMETLLKQGVARGFRLNWHLHPPEAWLQHPNHPRLWHAAGDLGAPLCIQCTPAYLSLVSEMCDRFPNVRVVIDHLARIETANGSSHADFLALLSLARYPNVHVKLSGLYYCSREAPPYPDALPFIRRIVDNFTTRRCLWGSDFPFINENWDYAEFLIDVRTNWGFDPDDQHWLLGETARLLWW